MVVLGVLVFWCFGTLVMVVVVVLLFLVGGMLSSTRERVGDTSVKSAQIAPQEGRTRFLDTGH